MTTLTQWRTGRWRGVGRRSSWKALVGLACLAGALAAGTAAAQTEPLRLRVVGGLGMLNQYTRHEVPFWTETLPRLSGGALVTDIVAFDKAGIRGQDMLRMIQLGTVPLGTVLLPLAQAVDPELGAADLPAMSLDAASYRRNLAAFRPYLARVLRERHGVELLAVYTYPAQMLFCKRPFGSLADLAGRRVRTSSVSQAELMGALGATPVAVEFATMMASVKSGNVECAITGSMSGNTVGLHEVTTHISPLPLSWGMSAFVANTAAWKAMPASARDLLLRELPRLEAAIWAESERETAEGVACNVGAETCASGRRGTMVLVRPTPVDERRLRDLFERVVLPSWVRRCGAGCAALWNQHMADSVGIVARTP